VGAPGDKLLFEDDFQFVERRLGKIAGFGIGEVRRYSGDNRDPGIRLARWAVMEGWSILRFQQLPIFACSA
jgi:hypothetical protein